MKKILIVAKDNINYNIHANFENGKLMFKSMNMEEIYFNDVEQIKEGHVNLYQEDEQIMDLLIAKVKEDKTLIERIASSESEKIMVEYQIEEIDKIFNSNN